MIAFWKTIEDPESYVRHVLAHEAGDIPAELIDAFPWALQPGLLIADLRVDEEMVRRHDATPQHQQRREGFIRLITQGDPLLPLIALGPDRFLVDDYARIPALRHLGISTASVCLSAGTSGSSRSITRWHTTARRARRVC